MTITSIICNDTYLNWLKNKKQAQCILKWHLKRETLFTISDKRPQEYYPFCLRSEILKKELQNNIPIDPIGVNPPTIPSLSKLPNII